MSPEEALKCSMTSHLGFLGGRSVVVLADECGAMDTMLPELLAAATAAAADEAATRNGCRRLRERRVLGGALAVAA